MADATVKIIGDKKLIKKLTALTKQAKNPTAIHKKIGLKAMADVDQQFRKEGGQFGKKWKPLKPTTIAKRRQGSSRILQDTGRLRGSANYDATGRTAKIGFSDAKAVFHQFGTKPRKARKARVGRTAGSGLPARPMLPMDRDLDRYVTKTVLPLVESIIARMIK